VCLLWEREVVGSSPTIPNPFGGIGRRDRFKIYFILSAGSIPVTGNNLQTFKAMKKIKLKVKII
jgi:hypothetical protein